METHFVMGNSSRLRLFSGIRKCVRTLSVTLGPRGRNVVLENKSGTPFVINDGVTISRNIFLINKVEDAGAQLVKEVTGKTNDIAGDGTTTAAVLASEFILNGLKAFSSGLDPLSLNRGIELSTEYAMEQVKRRSKRITSRFQLENVASIAAGNDSEIGRLISRSLEKVGSDGVLYIESSRGFETSVEIKEGLEMERGYVSPQFITDSEKSICFLNSCRVLVTDAVITKARSILPLLEQVARLDRPLFIVCEDISGEALSTLVVNKLRGVIKVVAIKATGFGERRKSLLQDLAIVTGSEFISKELGMNVNDCCLEQLGQARSVTVSSFSSTIVADENNKEEIILRIMQLKRELAKTDSVYDTEILSERIAKLAGGIALIKVGGYTETELEDRKLRVEDAKNAGYAALEEGILPGGGAALLHVSKHLASLEEQLYDSRAMTGVAVAMKSLLTPCRQIVYNAGFDGEVVLESLKYHLFDVGYNACNNTVENLSRNGVVDPAKVTRSALKNSGSIASLILTTDAVIIRNNQRTHSAISEPDNSGEDIRL